MIIIAGLGNPEKKYDHTRHNVGFEVIDELADRYNIDVNVKKHKALIGKGVIDGMKVLLVKPQTYMNLSGESLREVLDFYNEPVENLLVICDDVYLDLGVLRIRKNGSAGGHNGLKNIIQHLGTENFKRIRLGVGKQPEKMDLVNFVLSRFTKEEQEVLNDAYDAAAKAAVTIFSDSIETAMNRYNGKRQA